MKEILNLLPHRYPFLLIDKIIGMEESSISCLKNVTFNEPFFIGHFPDQPIMPGVLQVEAMAQASALYGLKKNNLTQKDIQIFFMGMDKVRFRQPVVPGDQLIINVKVLLFSSSKIKTECSVSVEDKVVSQAELIAMIRKK